MDAKHVIAATIMLFSHASADVITKGASIDLAKKSMESDGYKEGGAEVNAVVGEVKMWGVDKGLLMISYMEKTKKIFSILYHFQTPGPKGDLPVVFEVTSFDTKSGEMTIKTGRPQSKEFKAK